MSIPVAIPQWISKSFENLVISAVQTQPVPRHVSVIIDGNRRFARKNGVSIAEGHQMGYSNVDKVVRLLSRMGVSTISVWMFSMDNFRREQQQVLDIMQIINRLVRGWIEPKGMAWERGLKICVLGETSLLDPEILETLQEAMTATKHNEGGILNLLFPYNGRYDMLQAVNSLLQEECPTAQTDSSDESETVTIADIETKLMTAGNPPPDIMIRTSETRLSDFMNWQCSESTQISFCNCLWPEFSLWNFLPILFRWQRGFSEDISAGFSHLDRQY